MNQDEHDFRKQLEERIKNPLPLSCEPRYEVEPNQEKISNLIRAVGWGVWGNERELGYDSCRQDLSSHFIDDMYIHCYAELFTWKNGNFQKGTLIPYSMVTRGLWYLVPDKIQIVILFLVASSPCIAGFATAFLEDMGFTTLEIISSTAALLLLVCWIFHVARIRHKTREAVMLALFADELDDFAQSEHFYHYAAYQYLHARLNKKQRKHLRKFLESPDSPYWSRYS